MFYFWHWVYLMNVVLLWTLSVHDKCCFTFDFECTWWMLFFFWHWVYLMSVFLLLTECTWWMLFYFGLWVYLMNVVLLLTLSVPDECCSTFYFECTWCVLFYFCHCVVVLLWYTDSDYPFGIFKLFLPEQMTSPRVLVEFVLLNL